MRQLIRSVIFLALLLFVAVGTLEAQIFSDDYYIRKIKQGVLRHIDRYEDACSFYNKQDRREFGELFESKDSLIFNDIMPEDSLSGYVKVRDYPNRSTKRYDGSLKVSVHTLSMGDVVYTGGPKERIGYVDIEARKAISGRSRRDPNNKHELEFDYSDTFDIKMRVSIDYQGGKYTILSLKASRQYGRYCIYCAKLKSGGMLKPLVGDSTRLDTFDRDSETPKTRKTRVSYGDSIEYRYLNGRKPSGHAALDTLGCILFKDIQPEDRIEIGVLDKDILRRQRIEYADLGKGDSLGKSVMYGIFTQPRWVLQVEAGGILSPMRYASKDLNVDIANNFGYGGGARLGVIFGRKPRGYSLIKFGAGFNRYQYSAKIAALPSSYQDSAYSIWYERRDTLSNLSEQNTLQYMMVSVGYEKLWLLADKKFTVSLSGYVQVMILQSAEYDSRADTKYCGYFSAPINDHICENGQSEFDFGSYADIVGAGRVEAKGLLPVISGSVFGGYNFTPQLTMGIQAGYQQGLGDLFPVQNQVLSNHPEVLNNVASAYNKFRIGGILMSLQLMARF